MRKRGCREGKERENRGGNDTSGREWTIAGSDLRIRVFALCREDMHSEGNSDAARDNAVSKHTTLRMLFFNKRQEAEMESGQRARASSSGACGVWTSSTYRAVRVTA